MCQNPKCEQSPRVPEFVDVLEYSFGILKGKGGLAVSVSLRYLRTSCRTHEAQLDHSLRIPANLYSKPFDIVGLASLAHCEPSCKLSNAWARREGQLHERGDMWCVH